MFKIQKESGEIFKSIRLKRMFGGLFLLSDEFLAVVPGYYIGLAVDELKNSTMTQSALIEYVVKIIFFACLSYFLCSMFMFFIHNSGNRAAYLFRKKIISSVLKKTPPFFKKYTSGDILARSSNDVAAVENYFASGFVMLMDSFAYPGVTIFMMSVLISWKLTLAVVLPIPLITLIYFSLGKVIKDRTSKTYAEFSKVNQGILELAEGIKLIRCYVNEQVRLKKLSSIVKNYFSVLYAQVKLTSILQPCTAFITNLCVIIAFCYGGYLVRIGEITSGNLVSFFVFVGIIAWSGMASGFYLQIQKSADAAIDRINALIKDNNEFPPMENKEKIERIEKKFLLKISALNIPIPKKVLQDISFEISQGEILGITGKTGSGKTSLIKQFFSLYPQNENIFVNNIPLKNCDIFSFRNKTAYVSQRPQLLSGTVCENLCFYEKEIEKEKILKVLEAADVKSDIEKLTNGIDTKIGEKGVMLSGGQRQRIALARALLKEPEVLILDDAISAVDADTEVKIIENLKKSSSFNICIISAHRLSAVQHADKIIVLDDGKIIQQGTHEKLIKEGGWYAEQFEYQHSHSAELMQAEDSDLQIDGGKKMKDKTNKLKINYRFFLSYLKYCKAYVFAAFVAVGIFIASSAYLPTITASVINADLVNMPGLKDFLIRHALLFLGTALLFFLSMYVKTLLFRKIANTACEHIQMDMAGHLLNLKMKHFDEMTSGNIMSRFSSDINAVGDLYFSVLGEVFSVILLCIVLYIRLAFMSLYLFGASFAYLPIIYFLAWYYLKKADKPTRGYRSSIGELNGFFNESINSIESVQAFCAEEKIEKEFDRFNLPVYTSKRKMVLLSGLFSWNIIAGIRTLIYAALLGVFGYLYFQGAHFLVGTLVIAISYNKEITDIFLKLFMQINIYKNAFVAAGRVSEIINFEHERTNGTPHSPLGNIKFSNTQFEYKEGIPILKGLDFNAEDGMTIAFVGKTGCGKSTIMNLILGFYENSGGEVLIDGKDIRSLELKTLRSKIAVVLQEPYLFTGTIFDNISLNDPFINRESCEKALKAVGGINIIGRSEKGLDAEVSENGKNFSEGERQIICFARAMVRDPKILILDEATANIDTETEKLINAGIEVLKKGRTTLIIAHRLSTVKNADIINVIDDGKLLESGTHEELIALNSKYAEWYRLQK